LPRRPRADHRRRLVARPGPGRQGAGERRQGKARRLLRERLMGRELDVQRVLVVGAGTMGTGIAQVAARAGYRTELFDVAPGAAQKALERISESLSRAVEKGRCTAQERSDALGRLAAAKDLDVAAGAADLVIEAASGRGWARKWWWCATRPGSPARAWVSRSRWRRSAWSRKASPQPRRSIERSSSATAIPWDRSS